MEPTYRTQRSSRVVNAGRKKDRWAEFRSGRQGRIVLPRPKALASSGIRCQELLRWWPGVCFLALSFLPRPAWAQEKFEYSKEARLDPRGNVYVSSPEGKLIKMASAGHCSETIFASDKQTVACAVMRPDLSWTKLEIYLKGGVTKTIEPGGLIREWHFWKDGRQIAVYSGPATSPGTYALYDAASARIVATLPEPPDENLLPQWAKSPAQVADESVPMSPALAQERTMWIAKVLRQIGRIKPGMRRKDLLKLFTTEGGLSSRLQRRYVLIECPYIKVDVRFKPASNEHDALGENPEDVIETISRPYLEWSVMD
ncbi:MAG: hypothetical protein LAP13_19730 [Acidobacteriia bacterium]|nr:hypothetical protein [Terriglobia bacterium]